MTLPLFGIMCSNSQLTGSHPFLRLFIFFCHHHHMECLLFSDLRIFSPFAIYIYVYIHVYIHIVKVIYIHIVKVLLLRGVFAVLCGLGLMLCYLCV